MSLPSSVARSGFLLRHFARGLLDALLPPQCLACGELVAEPGALCADCWIKLRFIAAPLCRICGWPFEVDPAAGLTEGGAAETVCGACLREPPVFDKARAALVYDEASRGLILGFKHADRTHAAPSFARWMSTAAGPLLADVDLIAPVPLHWSRLIARRYNQAALLSNALGRMSGKPSIPDLLHRRRRTPSQGGLGRAGRFRNVAGAFAVNGRRGSIIAGHHVLIVDDVMTTGATIDACAKVLRRAGAAKVSALTLARVLRPEA